MLSEYDLAIIGAGAGGLIAARFAATLGARVLLVERDRIGGDCTWTGCVPSKSLIRVAKAVHEIRTAERFGVTTGPCDVDMRRVRDFVQRKVHEIYAPTAPPLLESEGIDVVMGAASFESARMLHVCGRAIRAKAFLICTGASPTAPDIQGLADVPYFTYHSIFDVDQLPESLVVIGGGPLGMELAQAFQRLGSRVTVVANGLLPHDDPEAAAVIEHVCGREGIQFVRGRAVSVRRDGGMTLVSTDHATTASGQHLLVATGRRPNVDGLGLERASITHSDRGIVVDEWLRTNVSHIYAAGDVIGGEQFSHVAGWQAFEATRNALLPGRDRGHPNPMAWVTFTDPEVAQVGLTEAAARARLGDALTVTRWDIGRVDRAKCDDDEDGFIKLMSDSQGRLIGATIVASRAGEMSNEISLAVARRLTVGDVATAVHAYPTYSTALQQMSSQIATARWTTSRAGRLVSRLRGYGRRS